MDAYTKLAEIEDDGEAMEFMIECEMCGTWQHGVCMGIANEGLIPDGEYCCEKCKPERYVELIKYVYDTHM